MSTIIVGTVILILAALIICKKVKDKKKKKGCGSDCSQCGGNCSR